MRIPRREKGRPAFALSFAYFAFRGGIFEQKEGNISCISHYSSSRKVKYAREALEFLPSARMIWAMDEPELIMSLEGPRRQPLFVHFELP